MQIRPFTLADQTAVISLWSATGLTRPWNDPARDIARKLEVQPELFRVGEFDGELIGTAMAGYDGHRGWLYYLAIDERFRGRGYARQLVRDAECALRSIGCPKLNLMVRAENDPAAGFYTALGYERSDVSTLGRRLIDDQPRP